MKVPLLKIYKSKFLRNRVNMIPTMTGNILLLWKIDPLPKYKKTISVEKNIFVEKIFWLGKDRFTSKTYIEKKGR